MKSKQAVQLSQKKRTKYLFNKIKMCKKCNRYSVLKDNSCYKCGTKYTDLEKLTKTIFKNKVLSEAIVILIIVSVGILIAPTFSALYLSMLFGLLFCMAYIAVHAFFLKSEYRMQLKKLVEGDLSKIKSGIEADMEKAAENVETDNLPLAYDEYREIGDFVINDEMKKKRVGILNRIMIRKDMELELETLTPTIYNREFTAYALDVIRLNKSLVTKRVFSYFISHREQIEEDFGQDSLVQVSSAALRMKLYIVEYKDFLVEFIEQLPKERLLRLCSIIHSNPEEDWGTIYEKTKSTVNMKYAYDPDFKSYF